MSKNKSLTAKQAEALVISVDEYAQAVHVWYDKYYGGVIAQDDSGSQPPPPPPPPPPTHN